MEVLFGCSMTESKIEFCSTIGDNCFINGDKYVGGISGYSNNNTSITNSTNLANINATDYVGGVTGIAFYGTKLQNVVNNAKNIIGKKYVGGLIGYSEADISYSSNHNLENKEGIVAGDEYVGGITGINYKMGNISDCFNTSKIVVNVSNGGGITGMNSSNISNTYNIGEIDTNENEAVKVGGICGQNSSESYINSSYNVGIITSKKDVGGIVCSNFGEVSNVFYLETTLKSTGLDKDYSRAENDMKTAIVSNLGEGFTQDENQINSGFPILIWQSNNEVTEGES